MDGALRDAEAVFSVLAEILFTTTYTAGPGMAAPGGGGFGGGGAGGDGGGAG